MNDLIIKAYLKQNGITDYNSFALAIDDNDNVIISTWNYEIAKPTEQEINAIEQKLAFEEVKTQKIAELTVKYKESQILKIKNGYLFEMPIGGVQFESLQISVNSSIAAGLLVRVISPKLDANKNASKDRYEIALPALLWLDIYKTAKVISMQNFRDKEIYMQEKIELAQTQQDLDEIAFNDIQYYNIDEKIDYIYDLIASGGIYEYFLPEIITEYEQNEIESISIATKRNIAEFLSWRNSLGAKTNGHYTIAKPLNNN